MKTKSIHIRQPRQGEIWRMNVKKRGGKSVIVGDLIYITSSMTKKSNGTYVSFTFNHVPIIMERYWPKAVNCGMEGIEYYAANIRQAFIKIASQ